MMVFEMFHGNYRHGQEVRRPGEPARRAALQAVHVECMPVPKAFFRLLAVLLLAFTIPVQGMASIAAGQCMAFGHHQDGAAQADQDQDAVDGHDHAAHSHDDAATQQGDEGGKTSHCGPCAACCASAASIAGPVGVLIPSSASNASYFFSQFPPLGFQPDGLDRPPLAL